MKNAEMLTRCHELKNYLDEESRAAFDYSQAHTEESAAMAQAAPSVGSLLALLIQDLQRDIGAEECRAAGRLNPQKAALRIIKNAQKVQPARPAMHGAWTAGDRQCVCDGFRAFRLENALPGLPGIAEGLEPFNVDGCIDPARTGFSKPLELPDVSEVKAYIKSEKARRKADKGAPDIMWDFGEGLPYVNAQYLADALEILPDCTCRISTNRPELGGLYFECADGDGLLMSARRPKKA